MVQRRVERFLLAVSRQGCCCVGAVGGSAVVARVVAEVAPPVAVVRAGRAEQEGASTGTSASAARR